ncbi:peptide chain release factor N(5)-glutamine methyltransferase [Acinetobacter larvae]|uniref:Release factor glutamine methyltransferase n=1 Tax=Acinetobacter larvae TaxID=1789224 RepID=A0A1B2M078_9GAMM|nr:peptide chain release factor N(5)-glutamine methyltransferase [Acinetobacter larvae]AOA58443.1 protein-(glutamine-N5) methyltransferase, release factor-specific [Acinetobacter larvae]
MNIAEALALRGDADSYERQENAWLLAHILDMPHLQLRLYATQSLTADQQQHYLQALARIEAGEPLAYVTGSQPFWTLDLKVTADTLVPRPDTEVLVESALMLDLAAQARVLDLGTGSGAIALALASERPAWQLTASDLYPATLAVAQHNAAQHALKNVEFVCGAWYQALSGVADARFDLIVSNPPYIDPADPHVQALQAEPQHALVAGKAGMADLEQIIVEGWHWLAKDAWLIVEHGYDQAAAVRALFAQCGYQQIDSRQDYGGNDRISLAQKRV